MWRCGWEESAACWDQYRLHRLRHADHRPLLPVQVRFLSNIFLHSLFVPLKSKFVLLLHESDGESLSMVRRRSWKQREKRSKTFLRLKQLLCCCVRKFLRQLTKCTHQLESIKQRNCNFLVWLLICTVVLCLWKFLKLISVLILVNEATILQI